MMRIAVVLMRLIEVVDRAEAVRPRHFVEAEVLWGWGTGDDFFFRSMSDRKIEWVRKPFTRCCVCIYMKRRQVAKWGIV